MWLLSLCPGSLSSKGCVSVGASEVSDLSTGSTRNGKEMGTGPRVSTGHTPKGRVPARGAHVHLEGVFPSWH